ncbi:MAG: helix-turn-helix transcriptional regulator [Hyphomicrobiaceae bacterium]
MSRDELMDEPESDEKGSRKPNPIDAHVGSRVRLQRMLRGISQEKLGEKLGLTFQQIQKYEKGVNRIGASRLFELAGVLGVPVQFFYDEAPVLSDRSGAQPGFAEAPPTDSYVFEFLNTREGLELNRAFAKISDPATRRAIIELVRALAKDDSNGQEPIASA